MEPHVMVMAGGTGGHLFPALAVADWLKQQGCRITWLGSQSGMETQLIPEHGYPLEILEVKGVRGTGIKRRLPLPFIVTKSLWQAYRVLNRIQPNLVLGMGGFATGPGGLAARLMRIPLVIQEQNATPGLTNRILARFANKVFEAFPGSFGAEAQAETIGNPVRHNIIALQEPEKRFTGRQGAIKLLVLGGSLGARALNQSVPDALALMPENRRPLVRHQSGEKLFDETLDIYRKLNVKAEVKAFEKEMAEAYSWADLVICRAGALTVSELAAAGLGAVLVPYPYAVDDHQTRNAEFLVNANAAHLLPQPSLDGRNLVQLLGSLCSDRETLLAMAKAARSLARPDAAAQVGRYCLGMIKS
ncbi:MAG: undecaprenyldiphospho-muramoylpentapeptide beta-N-acetylglucosaminyltransferase [Candidatus Thiodiazotropha sp. (ex Lucinoma aequizonata)]|nr:undecaprenyldiphospho-muramoylpentapeptide beta-N-acetylglucosaminyltransferase [Candidatus Thiodiazotropha sp. (ex Lucinoma aequizonata)]MCU7889541.1 undecaprenyldiphospho-muramoylpentapeptide beta-N-acetylglucosaminyltransferase [Candidatus Thiodiazotropha sp. (ex Lucinoma aequizonata)]MCU7894506.1 undecaprenyldiphospho-muramoylpentapeptide beta-N-acetylglucosaminyltransferase [Candidatus Thiodiazotropha sp. (ex Lucinoma aequizonata)]MCU7898871.1 undecaprenyldiphospho-muramoylpentapeptide b